MHQNLIYIEYLIKLEEYKRMKFQTIKLHKFELQQKIKLGKRVR